MVQKEVLGPFEDLNNKSQKPRFDSQPDCKMLMYVQSVLLYAHCVVWAGSRVRSGWVSILTFLSNMDHRHSIRNA